ncbi:nitroreductase [Sulfurospirillum multivorans]|uniref:Nitroreductase n=2 Tax=Sulfurospirillum multivorans TaxID=66821 RepID=A0AA86AQ20_SULMK|nr:nitroreductase [Sulfurospirillum multivorans]AHJ14294.1 nitroreductase [Sulfurospirillum multivorans DSM 12446]QEH07780.1 nitroreductase [Sulfurospirillum multivorans]
MTVSEAFKARKSSRAFLPQEVSPTLIEAILNDAKHAPSGVNMQPWHVYVVSGEKKHTLETKVIEAFEQGRKEVMDYAYYPSTWGEPYKSRRKETGLLMYSTLGISKEDKLRQIEQWKLNYRAFDAPVVLYFFIDANLEKGSYLDYGMFLQSVMLSATEKGLATCPQAALAEFPSIVKEELGTPENMLLLCGMALGYEDKEALINSYRTPRISLDSFVTFYR